MVFGLTFFVTFEQRRNFENIILMRYLKTMNFTWIGRDETNKLSISKIKILLRYL